MEKVAGKYDAIVVGGGPGGAVAAAFMVRDGLRVLLLDQATFPRDKVCGDGLSGKVVDTLRKLDLIEQVQGTEHVGARGVVFTSPAGDELTFSLPPNVEDSPGFVCTRTLFDNVLFQHAVKSGVECWENARVTGLVRQGDEVTGVRVKRDGQEIEVSAPLTIGADGAYSVVARELGMAQLSERHYIAGLRAYYTGVTGIKDNDHIELHFMDEAAPGYFWIFPLPNGEANVGIGMLSSRVKKENVKLKERLDACIQHPRFRDRFAGAERLSLKGWGLPLGSKPRPMSGHGWMLVGDAASLIDPFTGEGIGNAMISAEMAANWASKALAAKDTSAAFLSGYDRQVLEALQAELRLSHALQMMTRWRGLLNMVIRKAARSQELCDVISTMFDNIDQRKKLTSPMFYWRVLTA